MVDQGFQGLLQVLRLLQGVAGRAVMPRQQALAKQKTAVIGFEQALCIGDQGEALLRAEAGVPGNDIVVEQPGAAQQAMAVDISRQGKVDQGRGLIVPGNKAAVGFVPAAVEGHARLLRGGLARASARLRRLSSSSGASSTAIITAVLADRYTRSPCWRVL